MDAALTKEGLRGGARRATEVEERRSAAGLARDAAIFTDRERCN